YLLPDGTPDRAEAAALARLRAGTAEGAGAYLAHKAASGTLEVHTRHDALTAAGAWYAAQLANGTDAAITLIARDQNLRAYLNTRAREAMRDAGKLGNDIHTILP